MLTKIPLHKVSDAEANKCNYLCDLTSIEKGNTTWNYKGICLDIPLCKGQLDIETNVYQKNNFFNHSSDLAKFDNKHNSSKWITMNPNKT